MRRRWIGAATVVVTAAVVGLVGCGSDAPDELLVYNAQHESLTKEWIEAFTRETGIAVSYRNGGDTELGNQLVAEGDSSPADVLLTENSPAMAAVERAGLFADLDAATVAQVPPQYRPVSGKWTGAAARATVFVYNTGLLTPEQLPASLLELQEPAWRGRWGAPPAKADFQAIVSALLALRGDTVTSQWLIAMKTNATALSDNIVTLKAVNAGEVAGGVIYHYYWFRDQANTKENSANTALHYFRGGDPGAFVSISGAGVLRSSDKQEQAQQFVRFITGVAGQQILRDGSSLEYPVGSGVAANPALVPLDQLQAPAVNPSSLDAQRVSDMMTEDGLL